MTITKENLAAKLVVGFVAVSMLFTLSFSPAKAATEAELQAQITALLAQIQSLQGELGQGGSTTTGGSCSPFTMDLTMGASGADVTALQNFLIGKGHAIAAGATGYFGAQTQAALAAFQTANSISPAAGYFGPITRAKVNAMCEAPASDDDANDDANDDDSSSDELSGEASFKDASLNDGDDTDLEEGQEDAPVAELDVEFEDGDAKITRLDVSFTATSEEDPWDTFDEVSLWVDGDEVARMSASDKDDWRDDEETLRFGGLDIVATEDEELTIVIAASVQGSVDDMPATWTVEATEMRFVDADDVSETEDVTDDTITFDIGEEGGDDELIIKSSSEDPAATTLTVEDDSKSDWYTIFAYDLDTDESVNDITVNDLTVGIVTNDDVVNQVVSDIKLVIDGEEYDDVTWVNNTTATATASFDIDGDLVIEAGERVTVEVQVEFKAMTSNYDEGESIYATASSTETDAEGADTLTVADDQLSGASTGDTHTLRTSGAVVELSEVSEDLKENLDSDLSDDEGVYTIEFEVTAFETDLYIEDATPTRGTTESNTGANYVITTGGTATTAGTPVATLDSSAELESGRYLVPEGETETFTLTVEYNPDISGAYKVQLYSVNYNNTNDDADTQQLTTPAEDFDTDSLTI